MLKHLYEPMSLTVFLWHLQAMQTTLFSFSDLYFCRIEQEKKELLLKITLRLQLQSSLKIAHYFH